MEIRIKYANDFKLQTIFAKWSILEFACDYNKSKVFCEHQKSYVTVFWNGISSYPDAILHVQSQQ